MRNCWKLAIAWKECGVIYDLAPQFYCSSYYQHVEEIY